MPTAAATAYEKFKKRAKGDVSEAKATFAPLVRLTNKEGKGGAVLSGKLVGRKTVKIKDAEQIVYDLILADTTAEVVLKKGEDWVPTSAKAGDLVSFFAPRRLDRVLAPLAKNTEVFIKYTGKGPVPSKMGGDVQAHLFEVEFDEGEAPEAGDLD